MPNSVTIVLQATSNLLNQALRAGEVAITNFAARAEAAAASSQFAFAAVSAAIGYSVGQALEAEASQRKLATALEASGNVVSDWYPRLIQSSTAISEVTKYNDEAVQGFMSLALQMGAAADQVEQFTKDAISLSAATSGRLGVEGALRLVIGAGEEEYQMFGRLMPQVKAMKTDSERLAFIKRIEAIGWKAATDEIKGSAATYTETKKAVGEAAESLGSVFIPHLRSAAVFAKATAQSLQAFTDANKVLAGYVAGTAYALLGLLALGPPIVSWGTKIAGMFGMLATAARAMIATPIGAALTTIAVLAAVGAASMYDLHAQFVLATGSAQSLTDAYKQLHAAKAAADNANDNDKPAAIRKEIDARRALAAERAAEAAEFRKRAATIRNEVEEWSDVNSSASLDGNAVSSESLDNAIQEATELERQANLSQQLADAENARAERLSRSLVDEKEVTAQREARAKVTQEQYDKDLAAARLSAAQAGKDELARAKLAILARGYTEEQAQALIVEIEREDAINKRVEAEKKAADQAKANAAQQRGDLLEIEKSIRSIEGASPEGLQIFDLANSGRALSDIIEIASQLETRIAVQAAKDRESIIVGARERLAQEKLVTAEREAQERASAIGRFEELTATYRRIQSSAAGMGAREDANAARIAANRDDVQKKMHDVEVKQLAALESLVNETRAARERGNVAILGE